MKHYILSELENVTRCLLWMLFARSSVGERERSGFYAHLPQDGVDSKAISGNSLVIPHCPTGGCSLKYNTHQCSIWQLEAYRISHCSFSSPAWGNPSWSGIDFIKPAAHDHHLSCCDVYLPQRSGRWWLGIQINIINRVAIQFKMT